MIGMPPPFLPFFLHADMEIKKLGGSRPATLSSSTYIVGSADRNRFQRLRDRESITTLPDVALRYSQTELFDDDVWSNKSASAGGREGATNDGDVANDVWPFPSKR